jgi:pimeloyl-ACP methyl ester carboxylesterase
MGGYATLVAGAADPRFKALVPMCPLVDPKPAPLAPESAAEFAAMLNGVSAAELQSQWASLPPVTDFAASLAGRPILLVTGDQDELFPPEHFEALVASIPGMGWERFAEADHIFSACRSRLVESIVGWLRAAI